MSATSRRPRIDATPLTVPMPEGAWGRLRCAAPDCTADATVDCGGWGDYCPIHADDPAALWRRRDEPGRLPEWADGWDDDGEG